MKSLIVALLVVCGCAASVSDRGPVIVSTRPSADAVVACKNACTSYAMDCVEVCEGVCEYTGDITVFLGPGGCSGD